MDHVEAAEPHLGSGECIDAPHRKILVGITTFNRKRLVEWNAAALARCDGIEASRLVVQDDCSTDYDVCTLRRLYPPHARVIRQDRNSGGADLACRLLMQRAVEDPCDIVVILDSDLVCAVDVLTRIPLLLGETSGFFSLLNTDNHPVIDRRGSFVIKQAVGAAGMVFERALLAKLLDMTPAGPRFDWRLCEALKTLDIDVACVHESLVQHIGFAEGQNSSRVGGDWASGFRDSSAVTQAAIQDAVVTALQRGFEEARRDSETLRHRLHTLERRVPSPDSGPPTRQATALDRRIDPFLGLHLVADGRHIEPVRRGRRARFLVPPRTQDAWLSSCTVRPSAAGYSDDHRDLGVCLAALSICDGFDEIRHIAIDHPLLGEGFFDVEPGSWRWTGGCARLPAALWTDFPDAFYLTVTIAV